MMGTKGSTSSDGRMNVRKQEINEADEKMWREARCKHTPHNEEIQNNERKMEDRRDRW